MLKRLFDTIRRNKLVYIVLAVGALVRIAGWGALPPGLNQDEASIGYDAYALLHYGIDRNGVSLPVHLIAWGSGQNALYAYLSMPFIGLFGLNVYSVRAASLLLGIVGMWALYRVAGRLFPDGRGPLLAAFLAAICPWQIMMSRWALESNVFPTLVLLAFACLLKGLERPAWLYGFAALMALSLYAYGTAYFFVPVYMACAAVLLWAYGKVKPRSLLLYGGVTAALAAPIALFVLINRAGGDTITTPFLSIPKLTVPRVEQVSSAFQSNLLDGLPERLGRLLELLAKGHDGLPWNAVPAFGYLYPVSLPFIAAGLWIVCAKGFKDRSPAHALLALWVGVAAAMALMADMNINRINIIFYPLILLAAAGLLALWNFRERAGKAAVAVFAVYFAMFASYYFTDFPRKIGPSFHESLGEAIRSASAAADGGVAVTASANMPYIYVLFYERTDPREFLSSVRYADPDAPFRQVLSFGKYRFDRLDGQLPGSGEAYVYWNGDRVPAVPEGYEIRRFKHYSVIIGPPSL